jgi:hypothetical protein
MLTLFVVGVASEVATDSLGRLTGAEEGMKDRDDTGFFGTTVELVAVVLTLGFIALGIIKGVDFQTGVQNNLLVRKFPFVSLVQLQLFCSPEDPIDSFFSFEPPLALLSPMEACVGGRSPYKSIAFS